MKIIRWVFVIVWTFYPIAYIIPAILPTALSLRVHPWRMPALRMK
jgi:hypothetical protein